MAFVFIIVRCHSVSRSPSFQIHKKGISPARKSKLINDTMNNDIFWFDLQTIWIRNGSFPPILHKSNKEAISTELLRNYRLGKRFFECCWFRCISRDALTTRSSSRAARQAFYRELFDSMYNKNNINSFSIIYAILLRLARCQLTSIQFVSFWSTFFHFCTVLHLMRSIYDRNTAICNLDGRM